MLKHFLFGTAPPSLSSPRQRCPRRRFLPRRCSPVVSKRAWKKSRHDYFFLSPVCVCFPSVTCCLGPAYLPPFSSCCFFLSPFSSSAVFMPSFLFPHLLAFILLCHFLLSFLSACGCFRSSVLGWGTIIFHRFLSSCFSHFSEVKIARGRALPVCSRWRFLLRRCSTVWSKSA